jgi:hypothetical protein
VSTSATFPIAPHSLPLFFSFLVGFDDSDAEGESDGLDDSDDDSDEYI